MVLNGPILSKNGQKCLEVSRKLPNEVQAMAKQCPEMSKNGQKKLQTMSQTMSKQCPKNVYKFQKQYPKIVKKMSKMAKMFKNVYRGLKRSKKVLA